MVGILVHVFRENDKYLKTIADCSAIVCDKILNDTDSVSTNVKNAIPTNMTNSISASIASTVSINFYDKKVRYKMDHTTIYNGYYLVLLCKT